jgi:hypothetical protein
MKAEHRKELQTNTLAANMTRLVQRIKAKPKPRTVLWIVLGGIVLAVVAGWWIIRNNRNRLNSELWMKVDLPFLQVGTRENRAVYAIEQLFQAYPKTKQGRAAIFQYLNLLLWDDGIKRLVIKNEPFPGYSLNPTALKLIKTAKENYEVMAEQVKDDPVLASEARYNAAVAQESLAVENLKNLEEAIPLYEKVANEFPDTARGKDAKDRLKLLNDEHSRFEIQRFYLLVTIRAPQDFRQMFEQLGKGQDIGASDLP